jgi:DNA (cytosine-5)-methyltransferase 1
MRVLDLFAGIGGFTLGLERAGFETAAFCEIDPYAQKVLAKHWPGVPIYDDVRTITAERLASDGIGVDVITGGFPCQDISTAGKQAGIQDGTRSGLWSECARLLGELRPQYAIFENVTNLLNGERGAWFKRVLWDISKVGYDAEWHCIPASELGAHHHRDRIWIVAYPNSDSQSVRSLNAGAVQKAALLAYPNSAQCQRGRLPFGISQEHSQSVISSWWETEPNVDRVADGVPGRTHRLKCLGNAVVPQIPELIGNAIIGAINE